MIPLFFFLGDQSRVPVPPGGTSACDAASLASARTTAIFGVPAVERLRTVRLGAGTTPTVEWTMVDGDGLPVDLSGCSGLSGVALRTREATTPTGTVAFDGSVFDAPSGRVRAAVDPAILGGPGAYVAEFAVLGPGGAPVLTNFLWLVVEPSLFAAAGLPAGPPTIAEVRLQLRDSSPAESRLLDAVTFDEAEIALSLQRPVLYWNESLPPLVGCQFTTQNFPFRYHWVEGAIANLFGMAAEWYRKNHLPYQAGGIAVDDMNKFQEYDAAAAAKWQVYKDWVRSKKISINIEQGYAEIGSPYGWLARDNWY